MKTRAEKFLRELEGLEKDDDPVLYVVKEAFELAIAGLEDAIESIHSEYCGSSGCHPLCLKPKEALDKIYEKLGSL